MSTQSSYDEICKPKPAAQAAGEIEYPIKDSDVVKEQHTKKRLSKFVEFLVCFVMFNEGIQIQLVYPLVSTLISNIGFLSMPPY